MFVHHPHDLGGVHRRTTTQSQDHVRLEGVGHLGALTDDRQSRVSFYFVEHFHFHGHALQQANQLIGITVVEQEAVGDHHGALLAFQIAQSDRQRTTTEVNRFRKFVPQHIFSPFSDHLLVDQVLRTNVFGDGVTTP